MIQNYLLKAGALTLIKANETLLEQIDLLILPGETWVLTGDADSGKSLLAQALAGRLPVRGLLDYRVNGAIRYVPQEHSFLNRSNTSDFYYQQRFNSMDSADSLTVEEFLLTGENGPEVHRLTGRLGLADLRKRPLIQLSNGENKRLQLAMALAGSPAVLILDHAFTGLDVGTRDVLDELLQELTSKGTMLILVSSADQLPAAATHVLQLRHGRVQYSGPISGYQRRPGGVPQLLSNLDSWSVSGEPFREAIRMEAVQVRYGERTILQGVDWLVPAGSRWHISGANGSGKSTLLSLVNGDNPQAYANRIWLFDRRRGSGESIWDIKKRTGYVSPELQLSFDRSNTGFEVVASGLFDTIGLFRQLTEHQAGEVHALLSMMDLANLETKPMFQLSTGQQRMLLIARALVKRPPLLILDEPSQGLDERQATGIRTLVDRICSMSAVTLLFVSHYRDDLPLALTHRIHLENSTARVSVM